MRAAVFLTALIAATTFSNPAAAGKSSYTSPSTITYNNKTYTYSSTSTCADGSAALRLNRKWWCPASATTSSTTSTASTSTTSTSSTSTTTTATTTTPTATSYTASLSWTIPTTRADGTALSASDLAGYEVYYTNDAGTVSVVVPVSGGTTASATVSSLASGNYSFAISAIDTTGLKSSLSSVVALSFP